MLSAGDEDVSFLVLLKNRNFFRLFLAQSVSSLGDWVGVIAIAVFAERIGGNTGVGMVMTARVLPGFVIGPIAGVLADRWDRRRTMVYADIARGLIVFSLPFFPHLPYLLIASMALESLTLLWGPAKDASLPHVVPPAHLTHANSLNLLGVYGPWPLSTLVFASLTALGGFLGRHVPVLQGLEGNQEALALWINSLTFVFSAVMIYSLTLPSSKRRHGRLDLGEIKRDLFEGLAFIKNDQRVRPWLLGVGFTFTAAGGVFSLGVGFVRDVLGGGQTGFAFLIGAVASGMIIGLLSVGVLVRKINKDVLFSASLFLLGASLVGLASMGSLQTALPIASALGFFGGVAYSTAYSLMHEVTEDELKGRIFSAAYTVIRIGTLVGLGLFPFVAGAIGDHQVGVPFLNGDMDVPATRSTLWLAGLFVIGGGFLSMRAISRTRHREARRRGYFVAFEGGEGAGKSTQMEAFAEWLEAGGVGVVRTREPGGTKIGEKVRNILLSPDHAEMDERTEALLYAADRAQHVAEVIRPALEANKVVVTDRFIDSSLAYQGLARGLGLDQILRISEWATGGLLPDLVFYLKLDADRGLERIDGQDRIEGQGEDFHRRVAQGYLELAQKFPARFVVVDAASGKDEVHSKIVKAFTDHTESELSGWDAVAELGPPGPPVPR